MNNKTHRKLLSRACAPLLVTSFGINAAVLEEVVITAQKRTQSMQDVGIAVTAFTGDQLNQLGFDNAQQVTAMTPGVTTIQPNGPSSYYTNIRGVAQNDFSGDHQESPVAIYVDEVYISAASGAGFQLYDFERVEVLRGPQGTLFGRNATGGLVHYLTTKPSQETSGYVDLTYADYDQIKVEGALGGALTDTISGRLSFIRNEHDGVIDNSVGKDLNDGDDWAGRGHLLFDFNPDVQWLLSARGGKQDINVAPFKHTSARANPVTGLGESFDGVDLTNVGDSTIEEGYKAPNNDPFKGEYNVIGSNEIETWGVTSNLSWQIGDMELVSVTDYTHLEKDYIEDSDASPNDFFAFFLTSDIDQYSQELRLSGSTDNSRWVGGAFYLNIDGDFTNGGVAGNFFAAAFPGFGLGGFTTLGLNNPFQTETESYAVFGQMEYDLSERFTLIAGLRWTREKKDMDFRQYFAEFATTDNDDVLTNDALGLGGAIWTFNKNEVTNEPGGPAFGYPVITGDPDDAEIDDDLITAKIGLDWAVNDDMLAYASYNRGIKSGGFNAPLDATLFYDGTKDASDMQFDEEVLNAYEVGFKWTFADGLARLNGAAYYYDYQDYQAFALESLTTYVFNTDAESYGMELELQAAPITGLDLMLGVGWIDNTVEDAYREVDGRPVDREAVMTPEWNVNGLARYEWDALSGVVAVQGDFTYMDEHYFQLKNSPVGTEDSYTIYNTRVSYTGGSGNWTVTGFVNNVTDEEYRQMVFDLAGEPAVGGFGMYESSFGLPRWWGVSYRYQFGE